MKVTEDSINHNAVRLIKELVATRYDMIDDKPAQERGFMLMTLGEIAGMIEMAEALKEVLRS